VNAVYFSRLGTTYANEMKIDLVLFQYVDIPVPSPKKDEVLIKIEAASINPADWNIQKGLLRPFVPKFPFIPGIHT
jgi:NADPH:quinone reductase-like Zn-dependent oxidoreductase